MVTYTELPREEDDDVTAALLPSTPQPVLSEGVPDPNRSRVAFLGFVETKFYIIWNMIY